MKKRYLYISAAVIVIVIIITMIILLSFNSNLSYSNTGKFEEKMMLLDEIVLKDDEINTLKESQNEHIAILSICDNKTQAIVKKKNPA